MCVSAPRPSRSRTPVCWRECPRLLPGSRPSGPSYSQDGGPAERLTLFVTLLAMTHFGLLALGLVAGVFAGLFGIGGGLIIVPALLYLFKMKELDAIGTSLAALIPPVGLLGAMTYYREGHMNLAYALLIGAGLFVGAYFGAKIVIGLQPEMIRRIYATFLVIIAVRMLIWGK